MPTKNGMRPIHPGEILREEFLRPMDMSANALAQALHVSANRITHIINEERGVSAETALRLSRFFGTTPEFWMNLQATYELRLEEERSAKAIASEVKPMRKLAMG